VAGLAGGHWGCVMSTDQLAEQFGDRVRHPVGFSLESRPRDAELKMTPVGIRTRLFTLIVSLSIFRRGVWSTRTRGDSLSCVIKIVLASVALFAVGLPAACGTNATDKPGAVPSTAATHPAATHPAATQPAATRPARPAAVAGDAVLAGCRLSNSRVSG
jgi:hypothetical protein